MLLRQDNLHHNILILVWFSISSVTPDGDKGPPGPVSAVKEAVIISYKGNMGVLIHSGRSAVMIDGLHEYYGPEYLSTPGTEVSRILSRSGEYSLLNLVMFTHFHRDHYSAGLARSFLLSSQKNRVAGSPQVIDSLTPSQAINAWNQNKLIFSDSSVGLSVYSFNVPHTGRQRHAKVQNIAYLIKTGGLNILHVGDADIDIPAFSKLKPGEVDVMIVPVWFLMNDDGKKIITQIIRPASVIATHISPREKKSMIQYKLPGIETNFFQVINQAVRLDTGY